MYKLIACDLDGTLLTDNKEISSNSIAKINEAVDSGVLFVLTTGRAYIGAKSFKEKIGVKSPLICFNGAIVYDHDYSCLYKELMEEKKAKEVIDFIIKNNGSFCFYIDDSIYTLDFDDNIKHYCDTILFTPTIIKYEDIDFSKITKILWIEKDAIINKKHYDLALNSITDAFISLSLYFLVEFASKNISKAKGIDLICEKYGISIDEVIAIGDAYNDIEMISHVGLGVAMNNSFDDVKNKAKYVTINDNNHDGVCEVIDKFVLNKI